MKIIISTLLAFFVPVTASLAVAQSRPTGPHSGGTAKGTLAGTHSAALSKGTPASRQGAVAQGSSHQGPGPQALRHGLPTKPIGPSLGYGGTSFNRMSQQRTEARWLPVGPMSYQRLQTGWRPFDAVPYQQAAPIWQSF